MVKTQKTAHFSNVLDKQIFGYQNPNNIMIDSLTRQSKFEMIQMSPAHKIFPQCTQKTGRHFTTHEGKPMRAISLFKH